MFSIIMQILVALILTYYFFKREKPKLKFLLFGYLFFFVSLILQFPFMIIQSFAKDYLEGAISSFLLLSILSIIIAEVTKYLSLKRFMHTKSLKNGIFFGIGWTTVESINIFSLYFYSLLFGLIPVEFNYLEFLDAFPSFLAFVFFFVVNMGMTVLVIFSVIKKKFGYLAYAIFLQVALFTGLLVLSDESLSLFVTLFFFYGLYLIFQYRSLKKSV